MTRYTNRKVFILGSLSGAVTFLLLTISKSSLDNHGSLLPRDPLPAEASAHNAMSWDDGVAQWDTTEADRLQREVRVLVWVMTSPKSADKALAVKRTWGTRVNNGGGDPGGDPKDPKDPEDPSLLPPPLLFFSSRSDPALPAIALNVSEGRDHLLAKTMQAFDHIYQHYFHTADFFMKVDDDTYVIMENLRLYLSHLDPKKPFVTGRHLRHHQKQDPFKFNPGFPSGGAGYVLSKAALAKVAERSKDPASRPCKEDGPAEDVEMARCLDRLGVPLLNSSDTRGGSRFHPYTPMNHVVGGLPWNWQSYDANPVRVGPHAINPFPITFHYIKPNEMKLLHYFVYHVRPYGVVQKNYHSP